MYFRHLSVSASVATLPGIAALTMYVVTFCKGVHNCRVPCKAPASVPGVQGQTIGPSIFRQANGLKDRAETNAGKWLFEDRVYCWMSGEAARINAGEAMKPQPVNKLPTAAFHAFENIGTSSQGNCGSELIRAQQRFPTLAIGKASDQAAVWLFCAVSSRQWFQWLGVPSSVASASLQARSSQADCVSFCHGDESWSADQASVALITSPWGNAREGSNPLMRPWQAKDDDRKHGRDRSAAERRPRLPCRNRYLDFG